MSRKNRASSVAQKVEFTRENTIPLFDHSPRPKVRDFEIIPKTLTQEKYLLALRDETKNIVLAYGPAGTGKTYLAMLAAIKALRTGECSKLIFTRPAVGVEEEEHGFLPGTLVEKMAPWTRPLFDVLAEHYSQRDITRMLEEQTVEISPLAFMRGRSLKHSWIIADEMQNSTVNQMMMLTTRLAEGSKLVITGDLNQRDRKFRSDNGLEDFIGLVENVYKGSRITTVEHTRKDGQRHPVVTEVLRLYGQE